MAWRSVAVTAAWVCAVAGAGALGAWSLANADTGGRNTRAAPLDDAAVRDKLAAARSASPQPAATPSTAPAERTAAPTPHTTGGTVRVTGGSVTAQCRADGRIYLTAWSPASGYRVKDEVARGPAAVAVIAFERIDNGDDGEDRAYGIGCAQGRPQAVPPAGQGDDDADDDD